MTQNNEMTKALVLYVPPVEESSNGVSVGKKCLSRVYSFYISRSKHYYSFLIVFVIISVVSRCVHLRAPYVCNEILSDFEAGDKLGGFFNVLLDAVFVRCFINAFVAFISGFTVFALPLSFISAFHLFYASSYMFFGVIDRAFELGFFKCFFFIALFAMFVVISTVFFTETRLFYSRIALSRSKKQYVFYIALFFFYLLFCVGVLFFSVNSLFS